MALGLGSTAEVNVLLRLIDELSPGLAKAESSLSRFGATATGAGNKVSTVSKVTTSAGQALNHFGGVISNVVKTSAVLGGSIALFAGPTALGAAIKSAATFQQQMELIRTQAGATQGEVDKMSAALLKMGASTSYSANELALGLYHVESVGYRGATALKVLTAAAQGARMGNADLESTTTALTAAVYSGIKGVGDLSRAMGSLDAIVGSGNMRMQDLVDALGTGVLASARAVGLSLNDVGAALATLTDQGVPAVVAATRLRTTFGLIAAPSGAAQKQLKKIGITGLELANDMRKPQGLIAVLQDLHDKLKAAGDISASGNLTTAGAAIVYRSFGASRSGTTMVTLLDSMDKVQKKYGMITQNAADFNQRVIATQETAAYKFAQLRATLDNLGVTIGGIVAGPLGDLAKSMATFLQTNQLGITDAFRSLLGVLGQVAGALGTAFNWIKQITQAVPATGSLINLLIGGAIVGKASSMLFGKNPFTYLLGTAASKLFGRGGGAAGAVGGIISGATPVYVTNWPMGFGAGGPGGPTGGGGGGGGGGWSLFGIGSAVLGGLSLAALWKTQVQDPQLQQQSSALIQQTAAYLATNPSMSALQSSLAGAQSGLAKINDPIGQFLYPGQVNDLKTVVQMLSDAITRQQAGGTKGEIADALAKIWATDAALKAAQQGTNTTPLLLREQIALLRFMSEKGVVGAAADRAITLAELKRHGGSLTTLSANILALKLSQEQAIAAGDKQAAASIGQDIRMLEQRFVSVEQARAGETARAAAEIRGAIAVAQNAIVFAISKIPGAPVFLGTAVQQGRGVSGGRATGSSGRPSVPITPDPSRNSRSGFAFNVHVASFVTARSNASASATQRRYGPSAVSAGAAVVLP